MAATREIFPVRRSVRHAIIFLVAFGVFVAGGLCLYVAAHYAEGLIVAAVFGLFELIIIAIVASPGTRYEVTGETLIVKKGSASREIPLADIVAVHILPEQIVRGLLQEVLVPIVLSEASLDLRNWWKRGKGYGRLIRFCSINIPYSVTSKGSERSITSVKVMVSGEFLLVEIRKDIPLLLSPRDSRAVQASLHRKIPALLQNQRDPNIPDTVARVAGAAIPPTEDRLKRSYRKWIVYSIVTGILVLSGVLLYLYLLQPSGGNGGTPAKKGRSQVVSAEEEPVSYPVNTWIDDNTFHGTVSCSNASIYSMDDAEARRTALRKELNYCWVLDIASAILSSTVPDSAGISPQEREELHRRLSSMLADSSPVLLSYDFGDKDRVINAVIDVTGEDLRNRLEKAVSEVVGR